MLRAWRFRQLSKLDLSKAAAVGVTLAIVVALPWPLFLDKMLPEQLLGIPGSYFWLLFAMPVLLAVLIAAISRRLDDAERHLRKFENE